MASLRDIRRRIKSVKNTRQITKAMELVAASKMKKAQQAAIAGRPYALLLGDMLAALARRVEEAAHPFLVKREVKTRGILLITHSRLLQYVKPDRVHVLREGRIVAEGGPELAERIEKEGFDAL